MEVQALPIRDNVNARPTHVETDYQNEAGSRTGKTKAAMSRNPLGRLTWRTNVNSRKKHLILTKKEMNSGSHKDPRHITQIGAILGGDR
jgi:hypothetical protein